MTSTRWTPARGASVPDDPTSRYELPPHARRPLAAAKRVLDANERRELDPIAQPIADVDVVRIGERLVERRRRAAVVKRDERSAPLGAGRAPERLIDGAVHDRTDRHCDAKREHRDGGRGGPLEEEAPGDDEVLEHAAMLLAKCLLLACQAEAREARAKAEPA